MEKTRLSHIDLIKSVAIFFVILYHSTTYYFDFTQDNSVTNYLLYFGRTILSTCVPLFFFANGYLLLNQPFELKKHINKTVRFILLLFIWPFLLMPTYLIIAGEPLHFNIILSNILKISTDWGMNLFWFLGALVCIYVLFPAIKALFDTNKSAFSYFTIICAFFTFGFVLGNQALAFMSSLLDTNLGHINHPLLTMLNPFRGSYGYSYVYFCFGGLICFYEKKILEINRSIRNVTSLIAIFFSCVILFIMGVYGSLSGTIWDVVWNGYDTVPTFINVFSIYVLCLSHSKSNKLIQCISCNTLGIYFTHGVIIRLTKPFLKSFDLFCTLPANIIYAFLILLICVLICMLFRRIPLLKKLI